MKRVELTMILFRLRFDLALLENVTDSRSAVAGDGQAIYANTDIKIILYVLLIVCVQITNAD